MNNSRQLNLILTLKDKVSKNLEGISGKLQSLKPQFKKMAVAGTAVFATVGAGIYKATQQASDAQEIFNKFDTVFQDVSEGAENVAMDLRNNWGLAESSAKELLSATGDMLTGFGLTGESALDLADKTNKLAIDLASFTNIEGGAERASKALTKALLGERESVKELGIAILEEDVKAKVEAMRASGELTDETERQAKAYATLQIAISQSKNAIGDFERTQDSLANQQRVLQQRTKEMTESLGQAFIPVLNEVVSHILPVVDKISLWVKENPKLVKWIGLGVLAIAGLVAVIGALGLAIITMLPALGAMKIALIAMFGPVGIFIALITALAIYWVRNWDTMKLGMQVFAEQWTDFWDRIALKIEMFKIKWTAFWNETYSIMQANIEYIKFLLDSLVLWWTTTWDNVYLGMKVVMDSITSLLNTFSSWWKGLWDNVLIGLQVVWESITSFVKGGVNIVIDYVESLANRVIDIVNGILKNINRVSGAMSKVGINLPAIKLLSNVEVPRLAEGGIVTRPTLAMVGEGNESEAVIPLSKLGNMKGNNVTVNIHTMVGEEEYAERMGDKILQGLKENQLLTSV